jgi:hypothetical protein
MRRKTFGVIAFAALFAASAFAASKKDWDDCDGNDPDRTIAACTDLVEYAGAVAELKRLKP